MFNEDPEDESIVSVTTNSTKNPYNNDMRDRMIKHASEIKFVKDPYTAPVTIEFSSSLKSGDNIIKIAAFYCKLFVAMKILDSTVELITQDGKVLNIQNIFPLVTNKKVFTEYNRRP